MFLYIQERFYNDARRYDALELTIVDSEFETTVGIRGSEIGKWRLHRVACLIPIYRQRKLPVAKNIARFYVKYSPGNSIFYAIDRMQSDTAGLIAMFPDDYAKMMPCIQRHIKGKRQDEKR